MTMHDPRLSRLGGRGGSSSSKSSKSGSYSEADNTLRSSQTLRLLLLVSEGVTGGLVDGAKSIYVDDVAVQNDDDSYNYEGVSYETRNGYADQTALAGFPAVENEQSIGTEVKQNVPITEAVQNLDATAVRVSIQIPALYKADEDTGSLSENAVTIAIDVRPESGTFTTVKEDTISGKCTSPYVRSYRLALSGTGPWYVRVRRPSTDSNGTTSINQTYWLSMTVIEDYQLTYPDSAILGLVIDASQFGSASVPTITCDWEGIEVLVPSNYAPATRTYTGVWDGTFQSAVTDNPAWIFYDLVVNDRYGLGQFINIDEVDKWALYEIAQYCDELVDDGDGGTEPRFTFNGAITDRDDAINVLTAMAGVFRGVNYWGSGSLTAVCDKPSDPVKIVTRASVVDGTFTYQGSALSARHTQVMVQWFDPEDSYRQTIEVVEDVDAIEKYGARQTEIQAIGCVSRGQAHRYGTWLLDTEQNETEVVTYRAGLDHADVVPGDVVLIQDPSYAGVRFGGRLAGVSGDLLTLTLDAAVTLVADETYAVTVAMPDGSLADRTVVSVAGETTTLTLEAALDSAPDVNALWLLSGSEVSPRPFRVLSVTENEKHQFDISALVYDATKYARVEENLILEKPVFSTYPTGALSAPTAISVKEYLYLTAGGSVQSAVTVGWTSSIDARVDRYEGQHCGADGRWTAAGETTSTSLDIENLAAGVHGFRVRSLSSLLGSCSAWLTLPAVMLSGVDTPPADVENFAIAVLGDVSTLSWSQVASLNLDHYVIRFSPKTTGVTWGSASVLLANVTTTSAQVPTQAGTYLIKAATADATLSANAALIETTVTGTTRNVVDAFDEATEWSGAKDEVFVHEGALRLDSVDKLSDWSTLAAVEDLAYGINGLSPAGIYTSAKTLDLGDVYTSRLTPEIAAFGDNVRNVMSSWATLTEVERLSGADPSMWSAEIEIRTTDDDPAASPTWSDWRTATVGDVSARAYQMRLKLGSTLTYVTPEVTTARLTVDMPDRIVSGSDLAVPAGGLRVDFDPPLKVLSGLSVSAQGMATGDYYQLSDKSESGFVIQFKNSAGTSVARTFDYVASGYGKKTA